MLVNKFIHVLVVDDHPKTLERLESALWVWPHRISQAPGIDAAVSMCEHDRPTAIIVAADIYGPNEIPPISRLRNALPSIPIIALGTARDRLHPTPIMAMGANAVLPREDLHRPTLHDLLRSLCIAPATDNVAAAAAVVEMLTP